MTVPLIEPPPVDLGQPTKTLDLDLVRHRLELREVLFYQRIRQL
jgi:hypothetical protein